MNSKATYLSHWTINIASNVRVAAIRYMFESEYKTESLSVWNFKMNRPGNFKQFYIHRQILVNWYHQGQNNRVYLGCPCVVNIYNNLVRNGCVHSSVASLMMVLAESDSEALSLLISELCIKPSPYLLRLKKRSRHCDSLGLKVVETNHCVVECISAEFFMKAHYSLYLHGIN